MTIELEKIKNMTVEQKFKLLQSIYLMHEIFEMDPRYYNFDFRFIRK